MCFTLHLDITFRHVLHHTVDCRIIVQSGKWCDVPANGLHRYVMYKHGIVYAVSLNITNSMSAAHVYDFTLFAITNAIFKPLPDVDYTLNTCKRTMYVAGLGQRWVRVVPWSVKALHCVSLTAFCRVSTNCIWTRISHGAGSMLPLVVCTWPWYAVLSGLHRHILNSNLLASLPGCLPLVWGRKGPFCPHTNRRTAWEGGKPPSWAMVNFHINTMPVGS